MDMLDREFPAIGSQGWPMQREDLGEVAKVRSRQSDLAHDRVGVLDERIYVKMQVRKSAASSTNNVLNDSPNVGITDTKIGELRRKEFVYLFDLSVIPKFLEVALDAVLVGALSHEDSPNYSTQHTPVAVVEQATIAGCFWPGDASIGFFPTRRSSRRIMRARTCQASL